MIKQTPFLIVFSVFSLAATLFLPYSDNHAQEAPAVTQEKSSHSTDHMTDLQKQVTLKGATEKPFANAYWDNHAEGIYVDIISGKALFSSTDKFDSGTGWPSFSKPIEESLIAKEEDRRFGLFRTEVKSSDSGAHLGHVFTDGPVETGGKRFCINSASLRFVPRNEMETQGYGQYLKLFAQY